MNDRPQLRIGVSGIGSIGFRHARLLSQKGGIEIVAADPVEEHLKAAESLPGIASAVTSFDEMLDAGLDGVIIATPDRFHVPQAEAACRKGIVVLVEKPVAENAGQAEHLRKVCAETNAKLLVGYPLRHNSVFSKAKEIFDAGGIGEAVSFHIMLGAYNTLVAAKNRFSPDHVNKLFVDYSHEWDYLNWFLGAAESVAAVSHTSGKREKIQKPNVVNALIKTKSGISGTAHLDYVQSPGQRHFTIIGDKGTIAVDAVGGSVVHQIYDDEHQSYYRIQETFDGMMLRQLDHFIAVVRGTEDPITTAEDGLNALKLADALILSADSGAWERVD